MQGSHFPRADLELNSGNADTFLHRPVVSVGSQQVALLRERRSSARVWKEVGWLEVGSRREHWERWLLLFLTVSLVCHCEVGSSIAHIPYVMCCFAAG